MNKNEQMGSKKYLVQYFDGDKVVGVEQRTAREIIEAVSMQDCHELQLAVYDMATFESPVLLTIYGTWHEPSDPLYIKVTDNDGNVVFDGYGTDH